MVNGPLGKFDVDPIGRSAVHEIQIELHSFPYLLLLFEIRVHYGQYMFDQNLLKHYWTLLNNLHHLQYLRMSTHHVLIQMTRFLQPSDPLR